MWVRVLEAWLTARLLASPGFHRAVHNVHKRIRRLRHGKDPEDMGGTNIEQTGESDTRKFIQYYIEELKDQIRRGSSLKK
ncbi:MAG: hypothetical protein M1830_004307 [Pleopsidium flavum]|nr:MAG: hypothetical protein M1830_004307 [Pleopsidium flavum]